MATDLNRLSFEANPPFFNGLQNQLTRHLLYVHRRAESPAFPQVDAGQEFRFVHYKQDVQRKSNRLFPSSTSPDQFQAAAMPLARKESVWDILESLAGTIEAPADWAAEHDNYLYGTPRRR